jgi:hypothetical protein
MRKSLWIALLVVWVSSFSNVFATPPPSAPEVIAVEFYKWYINEMAAEREPLDTERTKLSQYVTLSLIHRIDKNLQRGDYIPDCDYFICSQDYMDDWEANVTAVSKQVGPSRVSLVVTLGKQADSITRLAVDLVLDHGKWKISKVKDLTPP